MSSSPEWLSLSAFAVGRVLHTIWEECSVARGAGGVYFVLTPGTLSVLEPCCGAMDPAEDMGMVRCWACLQAPAARIAYKEEWGRVSRTLLESWLQENSELDPLAIAVGASELLQDFEQWLRLKALPVSVGSELEA